VTSAVRVRPLDLVHGGEHSLAPVVVIVADAVEGVAAELADGLAECVEVGGVAHAEVVGIGEGLIADEGVGLVSLGVLLLGVVDEAGVVHVGVVEEDVVNLAEQDVAILHECEGVVVLAAMDGADGVGAVADDGARASEALLSGAIFGIEVAPDLLADGLEFAMCLCIHEASSSGEIETADSAETFPRDQERVLLPVAFVVEFE
jgi:hypothetical protein